MSEQKIVYVNKEISSYDDDFIGMASQVESIEAAIEEGASMIGVIADYGSGKSSIGELIDGLKKFNDVIKVNILNIHKMETLDDANDLPSLFNEVKFKSLLKDDEVRKKIRDLMDNAGQGYKSHLTRLINDLRQCS